ncbi:MAG: glycosyl transferase family 2 [Bacteroidales bacterium 36-12]|nr:MAG: glycosyl transferase family 2 [Bacteroidales bacterium 36-12]
MILKFIKYCVVGFSGMLVDFGITWLLKEKLQFNKYVANTIGFISAATSNYVLNRIWTFESQSNKIMTEYTSFFIIALVGLGLNNLILMLLNDKLKMNFYLSKLIAILIVTLWNFIMNFLFTFAAR